MNYPDHFLYGLNPGFPQPPHCLHLGWGEGTGCPGHSRVLSSIPALYLPEASSRSPSLGQPKTYPDTAKCPCAGGGETGGRNHCFTHLWVEAAGQNILTEKIPNTVEEKGNGNRRQISQMEAGDDRTAVWIPLMPPTAHVRTRWRWSFLGYVYFATKIFPLEKYSLR